MKFGAYHRAAAAKDVDAVIATFADDLKFYSPTKKTPFEGKEIARWLFTQLFEVLEGFRFTEVVANEEVAVLFFTCAVGGREADGCDVLKFNSNGLVSEFRVLIRPLPALAALNDVMGARLAAMGQR